MDSAGALTLGGSVIPGADLSSVTHTGVVSQLRINTITPQVFDLGADLIVGGTTIQQAKLQSMTESIVLGTFFDNPAPSDFVYKAEEFSLEGAQVIQTDGLTVTIVMTEEQRSSAIRFSGTTGGDSQVWNQGSTALLSIADGEKF
jgi:hypothetical protein